MAERWAAAIIVVALLLYTAGCTQIQPPKAGAAPPWDTPVPTHTPRPTGELRVLGPWQGAEADAFGAVLDEFEAQSGIRVTYISNAEVADGLLEQIDAGTMPDVVVLPKPNWVWELAAADAISPLPREPAEAVRNHYGSAWTALARYDGQLYGVPYRANSKSLLWYRPGTVDPDTIQTLDDLEAAAGQLQRQPNLVPFSVSGADCCRWALTDWFENILMAQAGRESYEALAAHDIAWTSPAVRDATERYTSLLRSTWLLGGVEGMRQFGLAESFAEAFNETPPNAAMWLAQGSVYTALKPSLEGLRSGEDIDMMFFPARGAVVGTVDTVVPLNERSETVQLVTYLAQPEAARPWIEAGGFISPNKDVPLAEYPTDFARREAEQLIGAREFAYDLSDRLPPLLNSELQSALFNLIVTPDQIDETLQHLEDVAKREQGFR